jgi:hypothetical protein
MFMDDSMDAVEPVRRKRAKQQGFKSGDRVSFSRSVDALLSYDRSSLPGTKVLGTVVLCKVAGRHKVADNTGRVFVRWDDGKFQPMDPAHLRRATSNRRVAQSFTFKVASLDEIVPAFSTTASDNELVQKATKDLWSFRQEGSQYVIERLFDDNGKPIKA